MRLALWMLLGVMVGCADSAPSPDEVPTEGGKADGLLGKAEGETCRFSIQCANVVKRIRTRDNVRVKAEGGQLRCYGVYWERTLTKKAYCDRNPELGSGTYCQLEMSVPTDQAVYEEKENLVANEAACTPPGGEPEVVTTPHVGDRYEPSPL